MHAILYNVTGEVALLNNKHYYLKAKYIIVWDGQKHCQLENGYIEVKGNQIVDFQLSNRIVNYILQYFF